MRTPPFRRVCTLSLLVLAVALRGDTRLCAADLKLTGLQIEFFEKQVRPLLVEHCYSCHSTEAKKLQAGLSVDSRAGMLRGGDSGPALLPRDADGSLLIEAVRYDSFEMPPKGKLSDKDIETLRRWVEMGAPWPEEAAPVGSAEQEVFDLEGRKAEHWVWQPIQSLQTPQVADKSWPRSDLDRFILARLEDADLKPAGDADQNALVRRLYFDLIGLPPTPEQVQQFIRDGKPGAFERLVDRLLASEHFGERWGRHWLDLVRYAESRGHEFDDDTQNAYQYRDYVIRALNADVPYNQFVREHIAGDLLDPPRLHPEQGFNESVLGTGFWFLGEWVHSPVDTRKDESDRFDNMIDVMSKAFLGVTVSCARCHDHKFDAISTADYYALSGFLQSSDFRQVRFESLEHNRRLAKQLNDLDEKYRREIEAALAATDTAESHDPPEDGARPEPVSSCDVRRTADQSRAVVSTAQKQLRQLFYTGTFPSSARLVDYADIAPSDFLQDGFVFGSRPRRAGEPYLAEVDGRPTLQFALHSAAVSDTFWSGLESINEKGVQSRSKLSRLPRSGRTLRTPTFALRDGDVLCRVRGSGHVVACVDSHRLIAGPLHGETVQTIKPTDPWTRLNLKRYVGHRLHLEFTPDVNAELQVSFVVQGVSADVLKQLEQEESAVEHAVELRAQAVAWLLSQETGVSDKIDQLVQAWAQRRADLQGQVRQTSRLAVSMMDGTGEDDHLLIRGSASNPGEIVPRRFLTALGAGGPLRTESGSGRICLAEQINDPANPLASRVIVNRIWHYLMGRGIVATTDDFGVLGQRPTHPELLDHLATRFLNDGRSVKRMIRYIVLSRTYRMSSQTSTEAAAADPKNQLWHHRPPKRMEGEAIRDALLAVSGELDLTMFGEPVPIHLTPFMDGRGRPGTSGPLDGAGRRSIYVAVRRNFLSPFMLAFDAPVPFSTMGRRNVSNVPAQALIMMNDPFVLAQTQKWAKRALQAVPPGEGPDRLEAGITWMYETAFARRPSDRELQAAIGFLSRQATERGTKPNDTALWSDFAHALVNTKEFIFLR